MMIQNLIEWLGGRKFVYAIVALTFAFILCLMNKITGTEFTIFAFSVGTVYVISNVTQKAIIDTPESQG